MIEVTYLCPSTPTGTCHWEGKQNEVLPHFEKDHPDFFLHVNYINLELTYDNKTNYIMHLNGETYLVQIQYSSEAEEVEIKLRYLGTLKKAATISYYINIECGNFAFTSKTSDDEYHIISRRNGAIVIETNTIRAICGRKILDDVRAYINIEGETNSFVSRAIRRSFHTSKSLEVKVRQVFQRHASYRSSIRKKSVDTFEFVDAIRKKSVQLEEEPPTLFVNQILDDIINDALELSELSNEDSTDEQTINDQQVVEDQHSTTQQKSNDELDIEEKQVQPNLQETIEDPHNVEDTQANGVVQQTNGQQEFGDIMNDFDDTVELRVPPKFMKPLNSGLFGSMSDFFHTSFFQKLDSQIDLTTNSLFERKESFFGFRESFKEIRKSKRERTISVEHTTPLEVENTIPMEVEHHHVEAIPELINQNVAEVDSMPDVIPRSNNVTEDTTQNKENRVSMENEYFDKINSIKCNSCSIVMIPPIFMCLNGHSICLNCKPMNCPCRGEVTDLRNCDLEEISRSLSHPCRFSNKGCTEFRSCYEIRYHEVKCDYFIYKCPQCVETGKYNDIISHIKLLHGSLKISQNLVNPFPRESEFLVMHQAGLFFCTAKVFGESIEWTVIFCGAGGEKISFSCFVSVKSKKQEKKYTLKKTGNLCKSIIFLNELKNNRLKDKNAVLCIEIARPHLHV